MEFRIHEDARGEWERLCDRLGAAEARRWLRRHEGIPPEVARDTRGASEIYWLLFGEVGGMSPATSSAGGAVGPGG